MSGCPCDFTPEIRWECAKEIVSIVRAGKAGNGEIALAIQHASCFSGCAAAFFCDDCNPSPLPDDTDDFFSKAMPKASRGDVSLQALADELADCCPDGDNCPDNCEPNEMRAIDWGRVATEIIPLIWTLIAKLMAEQGK